MPFLNRPTWPVGAELPEEDFLFSSLERREGERKIGRESGGVEWLSSGLGITRTL